MKMYNKGGMVAGKKDKMSDEEKDAKSSVLERMIEEMTDVMGSKADSLKKVTVASDSKMGLVKGLDKAKEIMEGGDQVSEVEGLPDHMTDDESENAPEHDDDSDTMNKGKEFSADDMSESELEAKIQELLAKQEARKAKR